MAPEMLQTHMVKARTIANTIPAPVGPIVKPITTRTGTGQTSQFVKRQDSTPGMINVDYEFVIKALGGDAKLV